MKAKRRTADGRFARDSQPATAAETIGLATVAAGLVIGAAEHLSPAVAAAQQTGRGEAAHIGAAHHVAQAPPAEPAHTPLVAPTDATPHEAAAIATPGPELASRDDEGPRFSHESILQTAASGTPADSAQTTGQTAGQTAGHELPMAAAAPGEAAHTALAGAADSISTAMKTLLDHVEGLKIEVPGIADLQHQFDGIAENAGRLAQEIASVAGAGPTGLDLSEILGGPALPTAFTTVDSVTEHLPGALSLGGADAIPTTLLGAVSPDGGPDGGAVLHGAGPEVAALASTALDLPRLDVPHDAISTDTVSGSDIGTLAGGDMGGSGMAPLQLGFLGQSYTDTGAHHDMGSHGLVSPLHGFV